MAKAKKTILDLILAFCRLREEALALRENYERNL